MSSDRDFLSVDIQTEIPSLKFDKSIVSNLTKFQVFKFTEEPSERSYVMNHLNDFFEQFEETCVSLRGEFFKTFESYALGCNENEEEGECVFSPLSGKATKFNYLITISIGNILLGFAILRDNYTEMIVEVICSGRTPGLGSHILNACETIAIHNGISTMRLSSVVNQHGFYKSRGYSSYGEITPEMAMKDIQNMFDEIKCNSSTTVTVELDEETENKIDIISTFVNGIGIRSFSSPIKCFHLLAHMFPRNIDIISKRITEYGWEDTVEMYKLLKRKR